MMQKTIDDLTRQCKAWQRLVKGKDHLLVAYRLGRRPPESTLDDIDKAKKALRKFGVEI